VFRVGFGAVFASQHKEQVRRSAKGVCLKTFYLVALPLLPLLNRIDIAISLVSLLRVFRENNFHFDNLPRFAVLFVFLPYPKITRE
jgi:hypothetical protein